MNRRHALTLMSSGLLASISGCLDTNVMGQEEIYENSSNEVVWREDEREELEAGKQVIAQMVDYINEGDEESLKEIHREDARSDLTDRDDAMFGYSEHWLVINKLELVEDGGNYRVYVAELERGAERRSMGIGLQITADFEDDFGDIDIEDLPDGYDVDDPEIWRFWYYDNFGEP